VAVVGAEETYPMIAQSSLLAKLFGLPYFPITPTFPWLGLLGLIPLPSRWTIEFGEPIPCDRYGAEKASDDGFVLQLSDHVRNRIQTMINRLIHK
jgi:hypothetical protein